MNIETENKRIELSAPTTKILAIGHLTEKASDIEARRKIMVAEVPATVELYLAGKIEQWWVKPDASGVVFLLSVTEPAEADELLGSLPLGIAGMMAFDFIRLAPLTPLRLLL